MTVGQRIKAARKAANMTQTELAVKLGVPYQSIGQWERDIRTPKFETRQKLADALGIPVDDLYSPLVFDSEKISNAIDMMIRSMRPKQSDDTFEDDPAYQALVRIDNALSQLNPKGQQVAVERVEELTKIPDYRNTEGK